MNPWIQGLPSHLLCSWLQLRRRKQKTIPVPFRLEGCWASCWISNARVPVKQREGLLRVASNSFRMTSNLYFSSCGNCEIWTNRTWTMRLGQTIRFRRGFNKISLEGILHNVDSTFLGVKLERLIFKKWDGLKNLNGITGLLLHYVHQPWRR